VSLLSIIILDSQETYLTLDQFLGILKVTMVQFVHFHRSWLINMLELSTPVESVLAAFLCRKMRSQRSGKEEVVEVVGRVE
jgi:hypothetical protein